MTRRYQLKDAILLAMRLEAKKIGHTPMNHKAFENWQGYYQILNNIKLP